METFDQRLKSLRRARGLVQREAAHSLGIAESRLSRWESGDVRPNFASCVALADFYGVSLDYLMRGVEREPAQCSGDDG
jgi:transcriptional regulator with XRE-family HTH domain